MSIKLLLALQLDFCFINSRKSNGFFSTNTKKQLYKGFQLAMCLLLELLVTTWYKVQGREVTAEVKCL